MSVALKHTKASSPAAMTSTEEIRRCFPALARTHNGYPVAYFDGPGGTQVPRIVVEAMNDYLYHHNANTHWTYPTSEETDAIIDSGTQKVVFVSLGDGKFRPQEVKIGASDGDRSEVVEGLSAGDQVVTRANFLVDSESRLKASLQALGGGQQP